MEFTAQNSSTRQKKHLTFRQGLTGVGKKTAGKKGDVKRRTGKKSVGKKNN